MTLATTCTSRTTGSGPAGAVVVRRRELAS